MALTRGDKVTVYEDPFTRTKPEGIAQAVRSAGIADDEMESWYVRFPGDTQLYQRWINPEDKVRSRA